MHIPAISGSFTFSDVASADLGSGAQGTLYPLAISTMYASTKSEGGVSVANLRITFIDVELSFDHA